MMVCTWDPSTLEAEQEYREFEVWPGQQTKILSE